ncbi:AraC family transcriptional regulator [Paludibacter sp. 221]|uniref:helix-turn-helix domain-containing protein n=1 Tax=Paludibacter sp. 221 TaxID=2302939 RepID=UPI0013D8396D|nr:helix-turn-helix domain-containing protein [Paludibacter sp. 221]NDV45835.1 AraC family transcriptional regulator [Paludibacter sp. 221]
MKIEREPESRVQFISSDVFRGKMCGALLDIDEAYDYLVNDDDEAIPFEIEFAAVFICLSGEAEIMLDTKAYRINKGDLCVLFPHSVVQKIRKSNDFEGYALGANIEYISKIQIPSTMNHFLNISENPCISLSEEEQKGLIEISNLIKERQRKMNEHPFAEDVMNNLLMALCYEIVGIYTRRKPIEQQFYSRQDTIFRKFLFSLTKNCKEHRDVAFYANEQCLTPRYFSFIIKEKSGENAIVWIQRSIMVEAKKLLSNRQLTVQQISEELNFPNASFFGQFFKKHSGVTPLGFRNGCKIIA